MWYGFYLIEINLISNKLLEYMFDLLIYLFFEYLCIDILVVFIIDDRGMWDSILIDEYFVVVYYFNLFWIELVLLGENLFKYSFLVVEDKCKVFE